MKARFIRGLTNKFILLLDRRRRLFWKQGTIAVNFSAIENLARGCIKYSWMEQTQWRTVEWFIARFKVLAGLYWLHVQSASVQQA
jgi:hypothetical protein